MVFNATLLVPGMLACAFPQSATLLSWGSSTVSGFWYSLDGVTGGSLGLSAKDNGGTFHNCRLHTSWI